MRSIPIVEPAVTHAVGLVIPDREPTTPLIKALIDEARQLAILLDRPSQQPANRTLPKRRIADAKAVNRIS